MATPAGKFVLGQINTDHDAQQFLLDTETGKLWQVFYDSQSHAYLLEVPILTEEQAKKRTDVKPRGK
jgi:hypothetical protein